MTGYRECGRVCAMGALLLVLTSGAVHATAWGETLGAELLQPVKLPFQISHEPNKGYDIPYVPSQNLAAFPERLSGIYLSLGANGLDPLKPDVQEPVQGGVRFLPGADGYYMIHHRRAGVRCLTRPLFKVRMELYDPLATMVLGVQEKGRTVWLDEFEVQRCEVIPGRVIYELSHPDLELDVKLEAVAPAVVPAYGMIGRLTLANLRDEARTLQLVALAADGKDPVRTLNAPQAACATVLRVPCPRELDGPGRPPLLHDTHYQVLVAWDGQGRVDDRLGAARTLELEAKAQGRAHVACIIDSPGYDAAEVAARVTTFFDRNPSLPEDVRRRMGEEGIDTMARIVVNGEQALERIRADAAAVFDACCANWDLGVYRSSPVMMEVPDPKLNSLLALTVNDLYPGLVQPPGLCHDTKYGDPWHYIFAYRHIHGASDLGLESKAIDYMRMLSTNQKLDGWIRSVGRNFRDDAHPTSFEASYIDALYHYYKWTGDLSSVQQLWPVLVRALQYIEASLNPDDDYLYRDTIHQWKSDADSRGPSSCFQTALVRKAYADMAEFAGLQNLPYLQDYYATKAKRIYEAAQRELWSDEMAMLGSKCPLGVLRLHPECLEVEIPIWTGLTDPWQSFVIADWFLANCSFRDEKGGLWLKESDWWPLMWSQAMIADGDATMVARALLLTGHYDEGGRLLETIATSSYRSASPGFSYIVYPGGVYLHGGVGGMDPATVLGAVARTTVETLFGVEPHLDQKRLVIQPRLPSHWDHAAFERAGLSMKWLRQDATQTLNITTPQDVSVTAVLSVRNPVREVRVNGEPAEYRMTPGMKHANVTVELPGGGGEVALTVDDGTIRVEAPTSLQVGETATIRLTGADAVDTDDRYGFFDIQSLTPGEFQVRLKKAACGRATLFLNCGVGNACWIEPVVFSTLPKTAKEVTAQTVTEPLPAGVKAIPVDLAATYTDDIQRCFDHNWHWDHGKYWPHQGDPYRPWIQYWFQPIFRLSKPLPQEIEVGGVPFLLGPMGPGEELEKANDLVMLGNTEPHELATGVRFDINRRLHKVYLLSLNMQVSMKSYVPAVDVTVRYEDGTEAVTRLISPLNFDTYEQDCGTNTVAYPLVDIEPIHNSSVGPDYPGHQHHLTMTDVVCDPARKVASIEIRSIATETFFGLAGMTLAAVDE